MRKLLLGLVFISTQSFAALNPVDPLDSGLVILRTSIEVSQFLKQQVQKNCSMTDIESMSYLVQKNGDQIQEKFLFEIRENLPGPRIYAFEDLETELVVLSNVEENSEKKLSVYYTNGLIERVTLQIDQSGDSHVLDCVTGQAR